MDDTKKILFVILPTLAVAGLVLIILSCALYERYFPLLTIPFLLLAPIPLVLVGSLSGGAMSVGPSQPARESALFITSALGSSALVVPFFLHHIEKIQIGSALFCCGGVALLFITGIVYQAFFNSSSDDNAY